MNEFPRKSDQSILIKIKNNNFSSADNIAVTIYYGNKADKKILDKYSVVPAAGWKTLTRSFVSPDTHLSFRIDSEVTKDAPEGDLYAEVWVKTSEGYNLIKPGFLIGTLKDSRASKLTLP